MFMHHLFLWSLPTFTILPWESYRNISIWQKQQCDSSEINLQGTLASILGSLITHSGPGSGEGIL